MKKKFHQFYRAFIEENNFFFFLEGANLTLKVKGLLGEEQIFFSSGEREALNSF